MRIVPVAFAAVIGPMLAGRIPGTIFLALAVVVGLPHGAFDHQVGRRAFQRDYGARWWQPFLAGYLALTAAMLLTWWALPVLALSVFLPLSVLHFGDQDAPVRAPHRVVPILAHGGIPIIVSAACHPDAIERLLAVLAPGHAAAVTMLLGGPLTVLWVGAVAVTLISYAADGQADEWTAALDLALVTLLFAAAPPLIAFSLYFAVIHAPRALAAAVAKPGMSMSEIALPFILTMGALGLGGIIFLAGTGAPVGDNVVRSAFLLLSALTVPHMWLERRARLATGSTRAVLIN